MANPEVTAWPRPAPPSDSPEAQQAPITSEAAPPVVADPRPADPVIETVDLEPVKRALLEMTPGTPASSAAEPEDVITALPVVQTPPAPLPRTGILLINLGTPDAPDAPAVRAYLKEFLSDPRVIERNSLTWRLVLNGFILRFRPRVRARAYRKIWNTERDESPLKTITRDQAERLADLLKPIGNHLVVDWAMRYGNPSIPAQISALAKQGCERILLMPLYPQYASATTATACDAAYQALLRMRWQPSIRVLPPYYAEPAYIEALAVGIETHLRTTGIQPDVILASYHGIPVEYVQKGDPYQAQCIETTRLLRQRLGLDEKKLVMTFQSRFGRAEWLTPYTDKTVKKLAKDGVKSVAIVTPGFSADCLETLEEIAIENAHVFKRAGGQTFTTIPCLNDSEAGMAMLMQIALRELKGWV